MAYAAKGPHESRRASDAPGSVGDTEQTNEGTKEHPTKHGVGYIGVRSLWLADSHTAVQLQ